MSNPQAPTVFPKNRSMPPGAVIPVLIYPDVQKAAEWLCRAFGFVERLRIGDHRIQLRVGEEGSVVAAGGPASPEAGRTHSVMVHVTDADSLHERAREAGGVIVNPPADHPYGERQLTVEDPWGHRWTFSQTIADVDPADWGGILVE
jgi:uncharacterized glyoxalase superfamily protein PhnB